MEAVMSEKRGSMRSKLIMSFYRAGAGAGAKAPPPPTTVKPKPAVLVKTTSFRCAADGDGYVHGPNGGAGDQHVDNKATSYIFHVKQRLQLEESNLIFNSPQN
ncbi:hypothetical protein C2S51_014305 [Perilla frutescens var. frutescens]|nr:hypothetical protein C2S51_014305 [Perilla frutescens var. frutescens]